MKSNVWQLPLALLLFTGLLGARDNAEPETRLTFEQHVRPIFKTYCFDCHGSEDEVEGGLDLRLRRLLVKGGKSGAAIDPGSPENSPLYRRIRDHEMPPREKKLPSEEIDIIGRWIAAGAPTAGEEPQEIGRGIGITADERAFWAFQPIVKHDVPEFDPGQRVRTPVDAFLLAALGEKGLSFSPDADKLTLLRRAHLDLTGLPPGLDETVEFLADNTAGAYERMLDRLLASRHYGERWGRHWLDVTGYADSEGYTAADLVRGYSYKYRDYVIRSFNADKPFDQFIVEQLAGDELVTAPHENLTPDVVEKLTATGFLRMAADGTESGAADAEVARNQVLADTLKIVSSALLGMSLECAECHDHRHDPILQTDYYRVRAIFEPAYDWKSWRVPSQRRISLYSDAERARATEIEARVAEVAAEKAKERADLVDAALAKELEKFDPATREQIRVAYYTAADQRTPEQKQIFRDSPFLMIHGGNLYQYNPEAAEKLEKYDKRIAEIRAPKPSEDFIRALTEVPGQVPVTYLFHRGDLKRPKGPIAPGGLTVTAPEGRRLAIVENDPVLPTSGRRLAYARWLTSGKHPLVARVLVNRAWLHHFGRGLVATPSDFGTMGGRPSHPDLLDWLASDFMEEGWSFKRLHKLIMMSTTYRQTAQREARKNAIDPENRLYWRKPMLRLDAEVIRDRILATSGMLNTKMYGPPVSIVKDDVGQVVVSASKDGSERRSVYIQVRRSLPVSLLRQFDMPVMEVNCDKRPSSTVCTQALTLMNGDFVLQQARHFADRLRRDAGDDVRRQVSLAWQLAYIRPPTDEETETALSFVQRQVRHLRESETKEPEVQAMTSLCQVLLGSSEFLYVD